MKKTKQEKKRTTSVKLKPSLRKRAKVYAINHDMEMSDLVAKALLRYMRN